MKNAVRYTYHYRPGYGSEHLLIEFISGVENERFNIDLFDALKAINPQLIDLQDLWMNDEVLYTIHSNLGDFILSKDIWDLAFITADHNQACITQINDLLIEDSRFEKIEVNFDDYKTANA